jgi:hypothetical protein
MKLGRRIVLNEFYFWAPSRLPIPNGGERGRGQRSNHTPKNKSLPVRNHVIYHHGSIDLLGLYHQPDPLRDISWGRFLGNFLNFRVFRILREKTKYDFVQVSISTVYLQLEHDMALKNLGVIGRFTRCKRLKLGVVWGFGMCRVRVAMGKFV